ncbi:MAG: lytic murein transglycosylase [Thermoleophilaceae bacterium]|nr:lytic murein transglycosylase [Thermoleophilaceae bacterium]
MEETPDSSGGSNGGPGGEGGGNGNGGGGGGKDPAANTGPDLRNPDGSPSRENPSAVTAPGPSSPTDSLLPGPSTATAVPNFIIEKFQVPIFLLPIYQAAGTEYGVRWEILAAINEIETDYGRNLNVSYAGAMGWMQFIPSSWRAYGVDANEDGVKDPYNPVDAIFAAARYLKAADYEKDVRGAIFAYNHADWYVDSVLMRARLIAGIPGDLTGSLTGLTEGRFPVYAKARYADDLSEQETQDLVARTENVAQVEASDPSRRSIEIYTREGAPAVAVNDGEVKDIGRDETGHFVVLQDVYGNRYSYRGLKSVPEFYPVPKSQPKALDDGFRPASANAAEPDGPASAGRQRPGTDSVGAQQPSDGSGQQSDKPRVTKERLFAHPERANAQLASGTDQLGSGDADARVSKGFTVYSKQFAEPLGLNRKGTRPAPLKEGARVISGTVLGEVGTPDEGKGAHLEFAIQPAGRGAPKIDPKPILDGWKLLEETAIYRARGQNVLTGSASVGQLLLLSKPLLERRVLADTRIELYECGRQDVRTGQIDRRVLVTLAYLAESGLRPTVTSLKCGHSVYTASGNVSNHSSGNAVDIAALNGVPVLGHQDPGGITEQAVQRILQLQGTMAPDEVISLFDFGGPSFALPDHADHIHVGFSPLFGDNRKLGKQALAVLRPGQWHDLIDRLGEIDQPKVISGPERFTLPASDGRASQAHRGE